MKSRIVRFLAAIKFTDPILITSTLIGLLLRLSLVGDYDNSYYTATVSSMLKSWGNFFFGSFDSIGLVMVDKPPASFWVQAIPSVLFGVSEWSVTLPQAILGTTAIVVLYFALRPIFGKTAARISALVLAVIPASVAIDSGNEPDAFLSFTLLLAAYSLIRAVATGKWRWLVMVGLLMGIGFNTKMLVAFIPLPVFLIYYLLASKYPVKQVLLRATLVVEIIIVVSLSWVSVVAFTPPDSRPYVGSTKDNSIWTLVFEYNGIDRFTSFIGPRQNSAQPISRDPSQYGQYPANLINSMPRGADQQLRPPAMPDQPPDRGLSGLFYNPLAGQLGWLLPVGIVGLVYVIAFVIPDGLYRKPTNIGNILRSSPVAAQAFLWGGWFFTAILVFGIANSTTTHPYYLVGVAVPLAATIGIAGSLIFREFRKGGLLAWVVLLTLVGFAVYQVYGARELTGDWVSGIVMSLISLSTVILVTGLKRRLHDAPLSKGALIFGSCVLLLTPLVVSATSEGKVTGRAAFNPGSNQAGFVPPRDHMKERTERLMEFLLREGTYGSSKVTLGGSNARTVSPFIVAGVPSISIGGFSGNDPLFTRESFTAMANLEGPVYFLMQDQRMRQAGRSPRQDVILDYIRSDWIDVSRSVQLPEGSLYKNPYY